MFLSASIHSITVLIVFSLLRESLSEVHHRLDLGSLGKTCHLCVPRKSAYLPEYCGEQNSTYMYGRCCLDSKNDTIG